MAVLTDRLNLPLCMDMDRTMRRQGAGGWEATAQEE
jgi:hypothetical protein